MSGRSSEFGRRMALVARAGRMFVRTGMGTPGPPLKVARQLNALRRWGTLLGGTVVSTAARDPDAVAIIDDEGELTYGEVDARTDRLAAALGRAGTAPRVAVLCRNHRGMVEALVAASKRGSDTLLLNTGMSTEQLAAAVREQEVEIVIADAEFAGFLAAVPKTVRAVSYTL
ncbi:AMP-binding protein, partial [Actinomadura sp. 7K507]|uniref:AMP-binding protein n=1 Tax=Actinomadura sp. 7K507 TaxID=2530365 RepID=UPI0010ED89FE